MNHEDVPPSSFLAFAKQLAKQLIELQEFLVPHSAHLKESREIWEENPEPSKFVSAMLEARGVSDST